MGRLVHLASFAFWFVAASIAMILIDVEHHRLPNSLTLSTYGGRSGPGDHRHAGARVASIRPGDRRRFVLALIYAALATAFPRGMGWAT